MDGNGYVNSGFVGDGEAGQNEDDRPGQVSTVSKGVDERSHAESNDGDQGHQEWGKPIQFLLSCIAMSVGLGNVWRFPTTAYENGGGAFLIPYLIVLTFIGRPLYFMELSIGQFSSSGSVKVWKMAPAAKGIGYGQLVATASVVTYYCALMGLAVFYFFASLNRVLPWAECGDWADENCVPLVGENVTHTNTSQSSSEQYFNNFVLRLADNIDDGIGVPDLRLSLCLLFSWMVIFFVQVKGVKSSGKAAYFTAVFPYLVLIILLIRGATLPGADVGIKYFITPQWEKLADPNVWYAACSQCFFSLSVGFGSIIALGSHNKFSHNIYRDAWIISAADLCASLLSGFTIFAILGNLAQELDTTVDNVVQGGAGLAFISYAGAMAKFDWAPQLFSVLFFVMLFTLGLGSNSANTLTLVDIICGQFPSLQEKRKRLYLTAGICTASFLIGLVYVTPGGLWILDLVDFFGGGFIIYTLVICETCAIMYIYGIRNLVRDIKVMMGLDLWIRPDEPREKCNAFFLGINFYWIFSWFIFIPVALLAILIYSLVDFKLVTFGGEPYPDIAYTCGWLLAGVALIAVPICFVHALYKDDSYGIKEKLRNVFKPKESWGPRKDSDRTKWLEQKKLR